MILRPILVLVLLLNLSHVFGQEIQGTAKYRIIKSTDKLAHDGDELMILQAHPFIPEISAMLEFQLKFNEKQAVFALHNRRALDKVDLENINITQIMIGYKDSTWQDEVNTYIFQQDLNKSLDKKGALLRTERNFNWEIQNETKLIGNYTCYKAIGYIVLGIGDKARKRVVIAWFCPEIPVPFGPINSGGLPGLIFQYQYAGTSFVLTEIDLVSRIQVEQLPNKEIFTEQELTDRRNKRIKDRASK